MVLPEGFYKIHQALSLNTKSIIFNTKSTSFYSKSIVFSTNFIIFNVKFIISIICNTITWPWGIR